jgi:hypothetical protein
MQGFIAIRLFSHEWQGVKVSVSIGTEPPVYIGERHPDLG